MISRNVEKLLREVQRRDETIGAVQLRHRTGKKREIDDNRRGRSSRARSRSLRVAKTVSVTIRFSCRTGLNETFAELPSETKNADQSSRQSRGRSWFGILILRAGQEKVIGMRTREGVPGLKRQRRKAETVELSKIGLPMLCSIVASGGKPMMGSTLIMAMPLPVIWRLRASYG